MQTPLGEKMAIHFGLKSFPSLFLVYFVVSAQKVGQAYRRHAFSGNLSACSKAKEGNHTLYRKVSGDGGVAICLKNNGQYQWKFMDGSSTFGEKFNPAKDCSDVVDNLPDAKDGFFWIKHAEGKVSKGFCDRAGYLLIGMKDSPVTWNVSSDDSPVHPTGHPHWSSEFGDVKLQDFAIQISTTKNFEDTKAHWSYRLKESRPLGDLFGIGSGGCTDFHSGIGNISYVKDILTDTVVTTKFNCSKFGPDVGLGWGRMNYCLRNQCPHGYAYRKELINLRLDSHGSFSYSASSEFSGVTHDATAFVGCDSRKCCACFGPKGGRGHYCGRKCEAMNGGRVLKGQVYVWYWIRTRTPGRLWRKCMEFQMKTHGGKFVTYHVDRITGTALKGTCSERYKTFLNEGTLLVKDKKSLHNLPPIPGLISFREDNDKLYVNRGERWDEIGSEKTVENLKTKISLQNERIQNIETNLNLSLQSLKKQDARTRHKTVKIKAKFRRLSHNHSQLDERVVKLKTNASSKWKNIEERLQKIETELRAIKKVTSLASCKDMLTINKFSASGTYMIRPTAKKPLKVYCDMETHGGGWTLVYSYTFTKYHVFASGGNAVTPVPNWPAPVANVRNSTTPPLGGSFEEHGAIDWNLWKNIGREFMIKSTINDWIVCEPTHGSIVTKKQGTVKCQNIKNVATACKDVAPTRIIWHAEGPFLGAKGVYYDFQGYTGDHWPTHDPCGTGRQNQKKNVPHPGGQIYLR